MLKDFAKLDTFLTVVKEKSFSKASAKLGISQPAVTQQIKFIEEYLDSKIVERKKNGIKLTKEGEELLVITNKLNRAIANAEKEVLKIINKEFTFVIGASFTIGNYLMPPYINTIKDTIKNEVFIKVDISDRLVEDLLDKKIDIALVETLPTTDDVFSREWLEDELVIFSNKPLPKSIRKEDLYSYQWLCRDENSPTRKRLAEVFDEIDVDCKSFDIKGIVGSTTAVKETMFHCDNSDAKQTVSIISRRVIATELEMERLYEGRIKQFRIKRKFYIVYHKDRKHDAFIDNVVTYLQSFK
jgi:DNA-binding transcriptional LysR family regulator